MLILDANVLIRAVLGSRVSQLLRKYALETEFLAPDTAFAEAREHLPWILERRGMPANPALLVLESLGGLIQTVEFDSYCRFESIARRRMACRDEEDWPVLAVALALDSPIRTEDTDFFGCGVATWTTDRVEMYLSAECGTNELR